MSETPIEDQVRDAWQALKEWQGPWHPEMYGDMSGRINGIEMDVQVKRWIEDDGTAMAAAVCNGVELERKIIGETLPN